MKTSFIAIALSLALSAAAAPQSSHNEVRQFGGFGGNFGNNGRNSNNNNGGGGRNNNQNTGGKNAGGNNNQNAGGNNNQNAGGAAGANNSTATTGNSANNSTATAGNNANGGGAAGSNSTNTGNNSQDPQQSLTLDPKVIASGFANNGQDVPAAGQVASLTSTNNFINFCLTAPNLPITNGQQIKTGSCNPAPMGIIPSTDNMPSSKFVSPKNGDTIPANTAFTITMAIQGMQTGFFVNADENYFAAPQQVNQQGQIQGHSHVVVETLDAIDQTTPLDPNKFAFFKGLNAAAQNGQLTADVDKGLPAGVYKLSSINTAANHQPVLVPIAQHGSLDDAIYFTVTDNGTAASNAGGAANNSTATGAAAGNAANGGAAAGNAGSGAAGAAAGNAGSGAAGAGAGAGNAGSGGGAAAGNAANGGAANTGKSNQTQNNKGNNGQNNNAGRGGFGGGRNRRFVRSRLF